MIIIKFTDNYNDCDMGYKIKSYENKALKKAKLLNEIRQGLKEVKNIREGRAKSYSMSDVFKVQ